MKQRKDLTQKPYYRCLICPRFRKFCGGRPTREMDLSQWCEYICDVMDICGLSISFVADKAEVSEKTVERIRSRDTKNDIMRATARRVEQVVLGSVGEHTCYLDTGTNAEQVAKLLAELETARKQIERLENVIDLINTLRNKGENPNED